MTISKNSSKVVHHYCVENPVKHLHVNNARCEENNARYWENNARYEESFAP